MRVRLRFDLPAAGLAVLLALSGCPRNRPPDAPATPSGPQAGLVDSLYRHLTSAVDPERDEVLLRFAWGDGETTGWSDPKLSGANVLDTHSWGVPGAYAVCIQAQDVLGNESPWSDALSVTITERPNVAPGLPELAGPSTGREQIEARYTARADDADGDSVQIRFDWGDGDTTDWSGWVASGEEVSVVRVWPVPGNFTVRAQARDVIGTVSGWSEGIAVEVFAGYPYRRVATFALEPTPRGVVVTPDGNFLYVAMADSSVAVIRTTDYAEVARVRVGGIPLGVAILPDGEYVYVANYEGWTVSAIRTADNVVVATVPDLKGPIDIAVLPDGKRVYVSCDLDSTVAVISTETNQVIRWVPVGLIWDPGQVAVAPDGEYVYVATSWWLPRRFVVIRTADDSVIARVTYGEFSIRDLMVTQDGGYLYATRAHSGFVVYRLPELTLEKEITGYEEFDPYGLGALPDGRYVYAGAFGEFEALVMRTANHTVVDTLAVAGVTSCIAVAPDGGRVYLTHYSRDSVTVLGY